MTTRRGGNSLRALPLYLTEAHIEKLLSPADALRAIEACFERQARGAIRNRPRTRARAGDGAFAVMSAVDEELGPAAAAAFLAGGASSPAHPVAGTARIAFVRTSGESLDFEIWVADGTGRGRQRLIRIRHAAADEPAWSPSGLRLAFARLAVRRAS